MLGVMGKDPKLEPLADKAVRRARGRQRGSWGGPLLVAADSDGEKPPRRAGGRADNHGGRSTSAAQPLLGARALALRVRG